MKQVGQLRRGQRASLAVVAAIMIGISLLAASGCGGSGAKSGATETKGPAPGASAAATALAASTGATSAPAASTTQGGPEAARFVSSAEAICKLLNVELKNANAKLSAKSGKLPVSAIVKGAPGNALLENETQTRLSRLRPPPSLAATWREMLELRGKLAKYLAHLSATAKAGNESALGRLQVAKKEAHQKLGEVAARASFKECGTVG